MTDVDETRAALRKTIWDNRTRLASDIAPGIALSLDMAAADRYALVAFNLALKLRGTTLCPAKSRCEQCKRIREERARLEAGHDT
jgi:hypothetical protein